MTIQLNSLIRRSENQVSTIIDGEVALLNLETSLYYGLDLVGATVWDMLSGGSTLAEICHAVAAKFDVDESLCQQDIIALLRNLEVAGLVKITQHIAL